MDENDDDVKLEDHNDEETDDNEENIGSEIETDSVEDKNDNDQVHSMIQNVTSNSPFLLTQPDGQVCIVVNEDVMSNPENLSNFLNSISANIKIDENNMLIFDKERALAKEENKCDIKTDQGDNDTEENSAENTDKSNKPKYKSSIMSNLATNIARKSLVHDPSKLNALNSPTPSEEEPQLNLANLPYDSESLRSMIEHSRSELLPQTQLISKIQEKSDYDEKRKLLANDLTFSGVNDENDELVQLAAPPAPRMRGRPRKQILPPSITNKPKSAEDLLDIEFEPPPKPTHPILPLTRRGRKRKIKQFPDSVVDADLKTIIGMKTEKHSNDEPDNDYRHFPYDEEFDDLDDDDDDEFIATRSEDIEDEEIVDDADLEIQEFQYLTRPQPRKRGRKSKAELAAMQAAAEVAKQRKYLLLNQTSSNNYDDESTMLYMQQPAQATKQILFEELSKKIMMKKSNVTSGLSTTIEGSINNKSNSVDSLDDFALTGTGMTDLDHNYNYDDDVQTDSEKGALYVNKDSEMDPEKLELIRKAEHNKVERRRRDRINNYIYELHKILPHKERLYNSKSKGAILRSVYEHYKKQCDAYKLLKEKYKTVASQNRAKDMKIRELEEEKVHLYEQLSFINQSVSSTILGYAPKNSKVPESQPLNNQININSLIPTHSISNNSNQTFILTDSNQSSTSQTISNLNNSSISTIPLASLSNSNVPKSNVNYTQSSSPPIKVVSITPKVRILDDGVNNNNYRRYTIKRETFD